MEDLIERVKVISDARVKRIFFFELLGLAIADENYSKNERSLLEIIKGGWSLTNGFADECEAIIKDYILCQERINRLVL